MTVLGLFLPVATIALLGFVLSFVLRTRPAVGPFLAAVFIMGALVLFGTFNALAPARIALVLGTVIGSGLLLVRFPRRFRDYLCAPGVLAFLAASLFLSLIYTLHGSFYFQWDEFSHWGPFMKRIYETGTLHQFQTLPMVHQSYPQGAIVFYYFTALLKPGFSEADTFVSVGLLLSASAACLLAKASWKAPVQAVLGILCVPLFFVLFPYSEPYYMLYMDTTLGAVFGAAILVVLSTSHGGWRETIALCLAVASPGLIKEVGFLFSLILVVFSIFVLLPAGGEDVPFKGVLQGWKGWWKKRLLQAACLLVAALGTNLYWKAFLSRTGTSGDQFSNPLNKDFFRQAADAMAGSNERVASIWERFTINFRVAPVVYNGYGTPLVMGALLVIGGLILGVLLWRKKRQYPAAMMLFSMPVFFAGYLFTLFYTYVCMMNEFEGLTNASYQRYLSTFMIGWCMLAIGCCLFYGEGIFFPRKFPTALPSAVLCGILLLQGNTIAKHDVLNLRLSPADAGRVGFDGVSRQMGEALQSGNKVWLIAQGDDGVYRFMFRYTLMPAEVDLHLPETLGYGEGPAADGFVQAALENGVEYILVYIPDETFVRQYASLFSDNLSSVLSTGLPSLYRVNSDGTGFDLIVATSLPEGA